MAGVVDENAPGTDVHFYLSLTWTCLSPLKVGQNSVEDDGFIQSLSANHSIILGRLTANYSDIEKISKCGDLPITLAGPGGNVIHVHFNELNRADVEAISNELRVRRGVVAEE